MNLDEIAGRYLQPHYDNGVFRQCLPLSWTILRDKHCQHPIAVMGVVDTLEHSVPLICRVFFLHYVRKGGAIFFDLIKETINYTEPDFWLPEFVLCKLFTCSVLVCVPNLMINRQTFKWWIFLSIGIATY